MAEAIRSAIRRYYCPRYILVTLLYTRCGLDTYFVAALKAEYPGVMGADDASAREEIEVFRRKWIYY